MLIWKLVPEAYYSKALLIAIVPLVLLVIGFRFITYQRIRIIRNQLYQIFQALEDFDADEPTKVVFEDSPFPIFNELNEYLVELIDRIRTDFQAHKQFTQNASHELQTPLAIIKGHVELLLQSPNIGEKEVQSLALVLQNANRLSKINSALILLSKIEHQRFVDTERVDFAVVADEVLSNFYDLIQIHNLEIRKEYSGKFEVNMSSTLAEILIANLVQNAIRHNVEEGYIKIKIDSGDFSITNPGEVLDIKPEALFKRFLRKSDAEESLGLGLSIVKRICEQSNLEVFYKHVKGQHTLQIQKNN